MDHRTLGVALLTATLAVVPLAGCGDDDGDGRAATGSGAPLEGYCEAALAWDTPPDPEDHEFDQEWFEAVLRPRFDDLRAHAPEDLAGDIATVAEALDGGDEAAGKAAALRLHDHAGAACGWHRHEVTATDHAFVDAPSTVDAGTVSFEVVNEGDAAHMLKIVRRDDGVTAPFAEIVSLPEQRQDALLEGFEPEAFVGPGERWFAVAELRPGSYAVVCELPVDGGDSDDVSTTPARTHATEGMVHEFTVE